MSDAKDCRSTVVPSVRYRDAHKAIAWLEKAFGFNRQAVHDGPDGTVAHAQLTLGNGMIMLGSASNPGDWNRHMAQPEEIGDRSTGSIYLVVKDAASVFEMAKAAGAVMIQDLQQASYGGWHFGCKDLEGHMWSIGEYDPWS